MEKPRTTEELLQYDSISSKHDERCELKAYQQASCFYHCHKDAEDKMCIWPQTVTI